MYYDVIADGRGCTVKCRASMALLAWVGLALLSVWVPFSAGVPVYGKFEACVPVRSHYRNPFNYSEVSVMSCSLYKAATDAIIMSLSRRTRVGGSACSYLGT